MGTMFFLIVWILMRRQDRKDQQLNLPVSSVQGNCSVGSYACIYIAEIYSEKYYSYSLITN